uniref:Uncharacterized protein TCIL3000_11_14810 n=1 Tax=Trypanosoma congolense (strain IL3000) TaxID=1068625 RepID=G0V2U2_TRYCI|nr:unnamed protein product [Trypanosoma congolense IL3000]
MQSLSQLNDEGCQRVIQKTTTLGWEGDDLAKQYLQRLVTVGEVILSSNGWKINHLKEFYPRSARLYGLNLNKGEEVCVRFRYPGQKVLFLPFEEVLYILLHEIAHCKYTKHDKNFWKLHADLVQQCFSLDMCNLVGNLGTPLSHRVNGGGVRLGGGGALPLPREPEAIRKILSEAAEGRMLKFRGCGDHGCSADEAQLGEVEPGNGKRVCDRCGNANDVSAAFCGFCTNISEPDEKKDGWTCERCMFYNYCILPSCEACGFMKLVDPGSRSFTVLRIKSLDMWPDSFYFVRMLGKVADALRLVLHELQFCVLCLEEFAPKAKSMLSKSIREDGNVLKVLYLRLRSTADLSEPLSFPRVLVSALHQLAHIVESGHNCRFLHAWLLIIELQLAPSDATNGSSILSQRDREVLLCFAQELKLVTTSLGRSAKNSADELTDEFPWLRFVFEGCGCLQKRGRDVSEEEEQSCGVDAGDAPVQWCCPKCSFANCHDAQLFCEMCEEPRRFSSLLHSSVTGSLGTRSRETVVVITDSDDDGVVLETPPRKSNFQEYILITD